MSGGGLLDFLLYGRLSVDAETATALTYSWGIMLRMVVDVAADELDRVHEQIAGRFARAAPRAGPGSQVCGRAGCGLEPKSGWTLAEQAREVSPSGMQWLLRRADWDVDRSATTSVTM